MIGIYCIENKIDGKKYIGQSSQIKRRLNDHRSSLQRNDHRNIHLQRAWNRDGEESFEFLVLCTCSIDELDEQESFYISQYNTMNDGYGYNLEGGGNRNKVMSEETRQKISKSRKGKNFMSSEYLEKLSKRMKGNSYRLGMKMPEDNKQKLIQAHTGNQYTLGYKHKDESKKKMSMSRKGNTNALGHRQSDEAKKKKSEAAKRFWQNVSEEVKEKMLSNLKSRHSTSEGHSS